MGKWAVHNYSTPAIEVDSDGQASHDGHVKFSLPTPLHVADTFEDAERWRMKNAPDYFIPRNKETIGSDRNR